MKVLKNCLILLCFLPFTSLAEELITEKLIENLISNIEEAAKRQDVEQLITYFVKDAKVTFEFSGSQGGKMELGLLGYKEHLKQGWSMPMKFSYQVDDIAISISENGKSAEVTDLVTETITMDGEIIMTTRTYEKIEIINVRGLPMITRVYGLIMTGNKAEPVI